MEAYFNLPLLIGVISIFLAQALKVPIGYFRTKNGMFNYSLRQVRCQVIIRQVLWRLQQVLESRLALTLPYLL